MRSSRFAAITHRTTAHIAAVRRFKGRNRIFAVVLAIAAALRVVTMAGYPVPWLYYGDSFAYLATAEHMKPLWGFQPSGYPALLWLLRPFHSLATVAAVQHLLGLASGVLIYAVLRRRRLPGWGASLAAAPILLDASFLQLEHGVLSDTLFIFLIVAAVSVLMWSPELSTGRAAASGALLAMAALTRTIAIPMIVLMVLYLLVCRTGLRRAGAMAAAAGLPLALYAGWYSQHYGRIAVAGGDGVALWARTMTFADCAEINPPSRERPLCPDGPQQDAASEYVWAAGSPINRMPGGFANNDKARSFALRAIAAQPLDYLQAVLSDTSLAFAWTPIAHPKRIRPAFGFDSGHWPLSERPGVEQTVHAYDPGARAVYSRRPYATFLHHYQYVAYLRGPMLAALLLIAAAGLRRRDGDVPLGAAVFLLVAPVAVLDFDHRYVLPVIPVACLAAATSIAGFRSRPPAPEVTPGKRRDFATLARD
ncbi:hypothetical protein [Actinomadura macrotermitis]|uniref:Glycosyltransferase RgtA/B/C/D-like domain-containing protein n=1 Tax=Actinomadura macrotermitis TaxID=2585200 RepID=A0A7K0BLS2_9ACTN|nr:hypothetical protein [Actinomadura macrotermitis]MQY02130.1 hypothetical protein [Actinomadura macrotermitis]